MGIRPRLPGHGCADRGCRCENLLNQDLFYYTEYAINSSTEYDYTEYLLTYKLYVGQSNEAYMSPVKGKSFFCSWSGGKDSCLALYLAIQNGAIPKALLTMLQEDGKISRSHGLPVYVLQQQAAALGIPLVTCQSSWDNYERNFLDIIRGFRKEGIEYGVFGDIDLEAHLEWVERVCSSVQIQSYEPLWKTPRRDLLDKFFKLRFRATIVAVKQGALDSSFLGRTLSDEVITEMETAGIDASGEEGEYHTVVSDGPIFHNEVIIRHGGHILREGYCFLDIYPYGKRKNAKKT